MIDQERVHEAVRARYAEAAQSVTRAAKGSAALDSCCGSVGRTPAFGEILYDATDRAQLPDSALLASLGCGNPTAVADLRPGERVLDLGSVGGIDVILSARRVGPTGRAIGLDMTDQMLELAVRNAVDADVDNVEFLKGTIEAIPLPAASID